MQPFTKHRGKLAVLDWTDINTDLIIPARYLKRIERTGFGPLLFADKRYAPGGAPPIDEPERHGALDANFPLNNPALADASILVVGRNFGCGSSREHAVWAVMQAGFRAVIAPEPGEGFADIFESNAFNNGLLVIELPKKDHDAIAAAGRSQPGQAEATVDLATQMITLHDARKGDTQIRFQVPEDQRHRLLHGIDAIAETLLRDPAIQQYEHSAPAWAGSTGAASA